MLSQLLRHGANVEVDHCQLFVPQLNNVPGEFLQQRPQVKAPLPEARPPALRVPEGVRGRNVHLRLAFFCFAQIQQTYGCNGQATEQHHKQESRPCRGSRLPFCRWYI